MNRPRALPLSVDTDLSISCALALSEALMPPPALGGGLVRAESAHFMMTGRIDLWPGYFDLAEEDRRRIGDLLRARPEQLATLEWFQQRFVAMVREGSFDGYQPTDPVSTAVRSVHGTNPRVHADRLLEKLAKLRRDRLRVLPHASPGRYCCKLILDNRRGEVENARVMFDLTDIIKTSSKPPRLVDNPAAPVVRILVVDVFKMADRIDTARGETHRGQQIDKLLSRLRHIDGSDALYELLVQAGGSLDVLQAPTGSGKTVLLEVLGTLLAEQGLPSALVVPRRVDAQRLTYSIVTNLRLLDIDASVVPLLSPKSAMADAETHAQADPEGFGGWVYDQFAYGCEMAARATTDEALDTWPVGNEPCTKLELLQPDRDPDDDGPRRACHRQLDCGKFANARAAVTAQVVVTAHDTLTSGLLHIPVETSDGVTGKMSVEELIMRRFQLIIIDEVDQFQSGVVRKLSGGLKLAEQDRADTPIARLLEQFRARSGHLNADESMLIRKHTTQIMTLAEHYLDGLRGGHLPHYNPKRRGMRGYWLTPRSADAWLTARLLGMPSDKNHSEYREPSADEVEALADLYRPEDKTRAPHSLFASYRPALQGSDDLNTEIRHALDGVTDARSPEAISHWEAKLTDLLSTVVMDDATRGEVVARMLVRAFLNELNTQLQELYPHTNALRALGADAADDVANAFGRLSGWLPVPTSPLGRLFFAYQQRYDPDQPGQARLSVSSFSGDPHAYTLYLGELSARGHARTPRAVLGLSATAYMPGAPHHHLQTRPTWYVPDDDASGVTIHHLPITDGSEDRPVKVSGLSGEQRRLSTLRMAKTLWTDHLARHLDRLASDVQARGNPGRDRVLLATSSYASVLGIAEGLRAAGVAAEDICVVVRDNESSEVAPGGVHRLRHSQIQKFTATSARILISPLVLVQRGVNILDGNVSSLGAIYMMVRQAPIIDEPEEMLAHINAQLWSEPSYSVPPEQALQERNHLGGLKFRDIVQRPGYLGTLPRWVQLGVVAETIVGLIQLVGRARRGGTPGEIYMVDHAFFDNRGTVGLPRLITRLEQHWDSNGHLRLLRELYGPTLHAFFEFAQRHQACDCGKDPLC